MVHPEGKVKTIPRPKYCPASHRFAVIEPGGAHGLLFWGSGATEEEAETVAREQMAREDWEPMSTETVGLEEP